MFGGTVSDPTRSPIWVVRQPAYDSGANPGGRLSPSGVRVVGFLGFSAPDLPCVGGDRQSADDASFKFLLSAWLQSSKVVIVVNRESRALHAPKPDFAEGSYFFDTEPSQALSG